MLDFIINPIAGKKHGKKTNKVADKVKNYLTEKGIEFTLHYTERKNHAKELTSDLIKNGATDIIVVGGDGTLHEVINGFSNFEKVNMGLIPCGTGNDFAKTLGIPKNPIDALDIIISQTPKYTDFMQMGDIRGVNVIGTGIDVDVLKRYNALKKKNKFNYTTSLIKTLFDFDYTNFTANLDGEDKKYTSFIACVANGKYFGGGIPICPDADANDNKLNFVAVKYIPRIKIVGAFIQLKTGKILKHKQAEHFTCSSANIVTDKPCTIQVDGELYENVPFSVKVVSNTLKMYRI